jgi:hypothetical protein
MIDLDVRCLNVALVDSLDHQVACFKIFISYSY